VKILVQNGKHDTGVVECGKMIFYILVAYIDIILLYAILYHIISLNIVKQPSEIRYKYLRKIKGDKMGLVYELTCDAPRDADVVERRLSVTVNNTLITVDVFPGNTVHFGEKTFDQGDNVLLSLVDVDDVGNVSEPALVEFVAKDTLPPVPPNMVSVVLLREV
jgi:hypothetical protein